MIKKYIFIGIVGLLLLIPSMVFGAITFDVGTSGSVGTDISNTVTISHTIGIGTNRALVTGCYFKGTSQSGTPSMDATYGGVSMTKIVTEILVDGTDRFMTAMFLLLNPTSGTANIAATVTHNGSNRGMHCVNSSWSGVKQTSEPDSYTSANTLAPSQTLTFNTTSTTTMLIDAEGANDTFGRTLDVGGGQTEIAETANNNAGSMASSYKLVTSSGSNSMSYSRSGTGNTYWIGTVLALTPEPEPASTPQMQVMWW